MATRFFNPAIRLMNTLTYQRKIILLATVTLCMLAFLSLSLFAIKNKEVNHLKLELQGIERLTQATKLIGLAQKYRGLSAASLADVEMLRADYTAIKTEIKIAFDDFIASRKPNVQLAPYYKVLIRLWEDDIHHHGIRSIEQDIAVHTQFIIQLQHIAKIEGDAYGLTTDSALSSYYLINTTLNIIPNVIEKMGMIRAMVTPIVAVKKISATQQATLLQLEALINDAFVSFEFNLSQTRQYLPQIAPEMDAASVQLIQSKNTLLQLVHHDVISQQFKTVPTEFFGQASNEIDVIYDLLFQTFIPELTAHIEQRINDEFTLLLTIYSVAIILWLLTLYFMIGLLLALRSNIDTVVKTVSDYTQGNVNAKINLNTQDRMQAVGHAINDMTDSVNRSNDLLEFQYKALEEHAIVSIADVKGHIIYVNKMFEEISQYSYDELIEQNHRILKSDLHPDSFFKEMWKTIAGGNVWHGDIQNRAKDGSLYWVSSTIVPQLNEQGKPEQYIAIRTDVTRIKELEVKQQEANNLLLAEQQMTLQDAHRLDTIIETAMDASIQMDDQGAIIGWNKRAEDIFGWSKEEALGHALHGLVIPERYRTQHLQGFKRCLRTGESSLFNAPIKITALNKKGVEFPIEISISLVEYNGHYQFSSFIRDLTQQKEYEKSIIDSKDEATKANKAKSEFLSSMSHELRTPLNAILGFGQLLESDTDNPLSADQKESVEYIISSGQHLLSLINDVLELSAIEAGELELSIENISLMDVINDSVSLLQPLATKANIKLSIISSSALTVGADYRKLKQVLINLISNAIKYNKPAGSITVEWAQTERNTVKVTVTDTGIGIPKDKYDKVFGAFNRLGQETSAIEGTGIGLVVTNDIMAMMGGTIGFDSTEGQGSAFWIELPIIDTTEIINELDSIEEADTTDVQEVIAKQILYVEDNQTNRKVMQSFFNRQPHTLEMAETGELGWNRALAQHFDLILIDIHLPGMDGKELTNKLRETDRYKDKPIIAVTAAAMKHDVESVENMFDDYVTKPLDFSELQMLLNKYLQG